MKPLSRGPDAGNPFKLPENGPELGFSFFSKLTGCLRCLSLGPEIPSPQWMYYNCLRCVIYLINVNEEH
ncbi:hypothetical protein Ahy_A03g016744 isoform D [Arachis hypogaea]|uniref:Uncharacterized protein n=1 Tax=Arachis hypogaea TaxID=3818 RepID=A0A445E485_ARAHY|nr:hypothetical protein Ahy_A03g016744 isoform D [Arachis hypogaea]